MSEYADTMSEICEIRAYEEGRLRALQEMQHIVLNHPSSHTNNKNHKALLDIIREKIDFTEEVIKDWTYDEEEEE